MSAVNVSLINVLKFMDLSSNYELIASIEKSPEQNQEINR